MSTKPLALAVSFLGFAAAVAQAGQVHVAASEAGSAGHGAELFGASFMFARGSAFQGGSNLGGPGGAAGHGAFVDSGCEVVALGCTATGGSTSPGGAPGKKQGGDGTAALLDAPIFRLDASSPVREGGLCSLILSGPAGAEVLLGLSASPGAAYLAELGGAVQVGLADLTLLPLGPMPASGLLDLAFPVGTFGTEGAFTCIQALFVHAGTLHLSGGKPVILLQAGF